MTPDEQISKLQAEVEQLRQEQRAGWEKRRLIEQERDTLRKQLDEVDEVLVVNWVGPRKDGNYRKALADLVTSAIQIHDDPQVSEVAAKRASGLADLRKRCVALEARLKDCAKMLRRGMKACERQGWEKGESTEAWYHAAGQMAGIIEIHAKDATISAQAAQSNSGDAASKGEK